MNYDLRKDRETPFWFRAIARRKIRWAHLTAKERSDLLEAIEDDDFVAAVLEKTCRESITTPVSKGGLIDWLKGLDWLRIIQIMLMVLMLFLDTPKVSPSNEG